MFAALKQRTGNGTEVEVKNGIYLYIYGANGIEKSVQHSLQIIRDVKPRGVILHMTPRECKGVGFEKLAQVIKAQFPDLIVGAGIGIDFYGRKFRNGTMGETAIAGSVRELATILKSAPIIIPNAESGWKRSKSDRVKSVDIERVALRIANEFVHTCDESLIWFSSFDQPTYHMDLAPFIKGFFGGEISKRPSAYTGQTYVAQIGSPKGALTARLEASEKALEKFESLGILPDDVEVTANQIDIPDDVDQVPTIQGHKTHCGDMIKHCVELSHPICWSAPLYPRDGGRLDVAGLIALKAASAIRRSGHTTIKSFQASKGLKVDGIVGKETLAVALHLAAV